MQITRRFIHSPKFDSQWKALGLDDDALRDLQSLLLQNPKAGPVIRDTGRLRKIRFSFGGRGKSHSARVCYVDFEKEETIFLITVFAKNEMENISKKERNDVKSLIVRLEASLHKKDGGVKNEQGV